LKTGLGTTSVKRMYSSSKNASGYGWDILLDYASSGKPVEML